MKPLLSEEKPAANHQPDREPCAVENVARVISEEPRLEAVAFESKSRRLSMATLGGDPGARLAQRVSAAVALPDKSRCGIPAADGTCSQCGSSIDARAGGSSQRIMVKQVHGNTLIEKHTCTTAVHFWRWEALRWPKFVARELELPSHHDEEHDAGEWKTLALQAAGCLLAGVAGLAAEHFGAPWQLALACWLAAYVSGAWEAAEETWEKVRAGELDVHFLMLAVAIGAAAIGAWHEGALLLLLFSASGAMEHYAMGRTQQEIGALLRGAPKTATVLDADGSEREINVELLQPGMTVRVTGGQQIPVDLRVTKGESACDESNLTGEARPVQKGFGDEALAGTINLQGLLEGQVLASGGRKRVAKGDRPHRQSAKDARPGPAVHRQIRHALHLRRLDALHGDVFRVVARVSPARFPRVGGRHPERVLPRDDPAGRRVAVRARVEHPLGDPFGHRVRRAARSAVPGRRGVGSLGQSGRGGDG